MSYDRTLWRGAFCMPKPRLRWLADEGMWSCGIIGHMQVAGIAKTPAEAYALWREWHE